MLQEVVDCLLICSKFHPDMFQHMVAIVRGSCVPYKLPKAELCVDCDLSRVASCCGIDD
jgi:hypothetical protein